ncbi:hypothetical protein RHMOL_Rhmol10G0020900 [Rhododendron molle]|uniref:Uncharacterized protein n=1 Tax=Rhododendron molle TaxID=49168 RepID=A0ACC0LYB1_RHOML|nr:hypothetical protein RHMOL_Rhmol10G0020900 [Rhododendron molle]
MFWGVILVLLVGLGSAIYWRESRREARFAAEKLKSVQSIGLMGAKYSREGQSAASRGTSSAWDDYVNPQPPYPEESTSYDPPPQTAYPAYAPPQQNYPPPQTHGGRSQQPQRKLDRRYSRIADNYRSLEEVTEALSRAGLESSNLIVGIDFTKSNEWTGAKSYNRRSLHHIGDSLNPYEQAISIIGKTLAAFDEDNLIPCYGFGDASTHDQEVFSFYPDERFCNGFEEVLSRYREIVPHLRLAGPTSFAPVIEMAMTIVEQSGGQYHVLVIIADGQVTRSVDTEGGQLSPQERRTVEAIVQASKFPLSIILVGVGDGPWDMMKEFDDNIPARAFDNFQFVNFTEIMSKKVSPSRKETEFALAALMEIPSQYKATLELNILGGRKGNAPERVPLPPPVYGAASSSSSNPSRAPSFPQRLPSFPQSLPSFPPSSPSYPLSSPSYPPSSPYSYGQDSPLGTAPPVTSSTFDNQVCPICLSNPKDMAFGCGHQIVPGLVLGKFAGISEGEIVVAILMFWGVILVLLVGLGSAIYWRIQERLGREARFGAEKLKSVQSIGLMGAKYSREGQSAASRGTSSAWDDYVNPQPPYPEESTSYDPPPQTAYPAYPPSQQYYPPPQTHGGRSQQPQRKPDRQYSRIADNYRSLEEVTEALSRAGLESSNLIVGIDFTKSNEWTGAKSYNRRSLHHIGDSLNPYEHAISIIGKTLAAFDEDNLIPCYGFGDASTHDQEVFSFYPDERFCNGFEEVLSRYREIVPHQRLAGPTSFAPVIEMAMNIVEQSGGQYHVLVIIADGQVTRSVDTEGGQLSPQERRTVEAFVQSSKFPLSIILVGVGDGPWDMMKEFDDNIPARAFDNFQFVNFTEIMSKKVSPSRKETEFALAALMEIPSQYKATLELNILGGRKGNAPERVPLPPPMYGAASSSSSNPSCPPSFPQSSPSFLLSSPSYPRSSPSYPRNSPYSYGQNSPVGTAPPVASSTFDNQVCPICLSNPKDIAFGPCEHQMRKKERKEMVENSPSRFMAIFDAARFWVDPSVKELHNGL